MDAAAFGAVLDATAVVLVVVGALLCLTAAIGVARFKDVPTRLHAATKPQVLGLLLICVAIALSSRSWQVVAFLVPVVLIQLATAPLSAHMLGRQAYRNGRIDRPSMLVDELAAADPGPGAATPGPGPGVAGSAGGPAGSDAGPGGGAAGPGGGLVDRSHP